ncbi:MAG: phosphoribosyltransferase [Actinomycetia bacterium]|nr:phosphoribosyltransferase [Actinomycetes bacterium]
MSELVFADRADAGRRLARLLGHLRGQDVVVVGLPRGGVPVAFEVARDLGAPLDVVVVRKLGVPFQPELGMGAIGEDGVRVVNDEVLRMTGVTAAELAAVENREGAELARRAARFRAGRARVPLAGRVVVVVDDGIATGSTARAACEVVRATGARRVVLAVPVAPVDWTGRLAGAADELVCVGTPRSFFGVGQFYADFTQTTDEEVVACLDRAAAGFATSDGRGARDDEVELSVDGVVVGGHLTVPAAARGLVLFAHGSGSSRHSPRNRHVARLLGEAGLATLLFDLLTAAEEHDRANVFDIGLLGGRLVAATRWVRGQPGLGALPVGYFGASTGAAAALWAAAEVDPPVAAVVSRGGRPDLAGPRLGAVRAPTLLVVGGHDPVVLDLNRQALAALRCERRLDVVPGATHLFEEPGTLQQAAELARDWFLAHLAGPTAAP